MAETRYEKALRITAERACDIAVQKAGSMLKSLKGGRDCFYPIVDFDESEIGIGINHEYHYLVYQDRGFASFPMRAIYGKVIPMVIDGELVFRKVTGINQWRPGHRYYWQRNQWGELVPEYRQRRAWVHPGVGPKNFISDSVDLAILENQDEIDESYLFDAMLYEGAVY